MWANLIKLAMVLHICLSWKTYKSCAGQGLYVIKEHNYVFVTTSKTFNANKKKINK